jgi:hypothetical protein
MTVEEIEERIAVEINRVEVTGWRPARIEVASDVWQTLNDWARTTSRSAAPQFDPAAPRPSGYLLKYWGLDIAERPDSNPGGIWVLAENPVAP